MPDFRDLLGRSMDDVKRPVLLPVGTYNGRIVKYEADEREYRQGEKTPVVCFHVRLEEPGEDIDPTELREEDGTPVDFSKRAPLRFDMSLDPTTQHRLKEFLISCGIETRGRSFGEALPDTKDTPVLVTIVQKPSKTNPEESFNNISKMTGVHNL